MASNGGLMHARGYMIWIYILEANDLSELSMAFIKCHLQHCVLAAIGEKTTIDGFPFTPGLQGWRWRGSAALQLPLAILA